MRSAVRPRDSPGFPQLWTASTVSDFGTYITALALQVLLVRTLNASATEIGLVNAARWVPYLAFGLLVGVFVDRRRRLPLLIASDLVSAVVLGVIPLLAAIGRLSVPIVIALMVPFGLMSLVNDAASMSFLPRLVAPAALSRANVRLQQSASAAQTSGPLVGSGLVGWLGAPVAMLVDAVSYLFSGLLMATIRGVHEEPAPLVRRQVFAELREGMAWVYRHPLLAPMALSAHGWFLFNSMLLTVFVPFAQRSAGLNAFGLGVVYTCAGIGGVLGSSLSGRAARIFGAGWAVVLAQVLFPVAFVLVVLSPRGGLAVVMIAAGMFLFGLAVGLGSPIELTYRQSVTPDRLQGRMNATIRSFNRGMYTIGGPVGGVLADSIGYRQTLWLGIAGVAAMAVWLGCSRFRRITLPDE
ncbi:MAG TPA: MFS transporter [Pseudonocardiaceae bacterium]